MVTIELLSDISYTFTPSRYSILLLFKSLLISLIQTIKNLHSSKGSATSITGSEKQLDPSSSFGSSLIATEGQLLT